jgi:hypothetical protein
VSTQGPSKKEIALKFLEESLISVFLDPRRTDVSVPVQFKKLPQLRLDIGFNMAVQIPDLQLDDTGFSCTLSFNRTPFWCAVPWTSVFAIMGDEERAVVWPDEVPVEVQQGTRMPKESDEPKPGPVAVPSAPALASAQKSGPSAAPGPKALPSKKKTPLREAPKPAGDAKKRDLPPYLRVIK